MVTSNSQHDVEARFGHLLQPIRDLTKNWDVDIASYLEEYLDELEKIAVTFDGGITTMNFAEAAMLIQGSACVYSRKVEYLYSLVYQILDLLANKKKQANAGAGDGNETEAEFHKDEDEEFLTLDDIQEHKNIGLKEGVNAADKSVLTVPQMPMSLIPLEEGEKGENPLLSKSGEVLASRNDFKMNTSSVHPTGTLLLDMSHLNLLEMSLHALASSTPYPTAQVQARFPLEEDKQLEVDGDLPDEGNVSMEDNDIGFDPPLQDEVDGAPPTDEGQPNMQQDIEEPVSLRKSARQAQRVQFVTPKPFIDPWISLDPHEAGKNIERKFRRGKTCKLPVGLEGNNAKKRKRKVRTVEKKLNPISEFINKAFFSHSPKFPKNQLKVTEFQEFEHIYWEEFKRRQSIIHTKRNTVTELIEEDREDGGGGDDDFAPLPGGDDDNVDDVGDDNEPPPLVDDNLFDAIGMESRHSRTVAEAVEHLEPFDREGGVLITSYEELVRQHVDQYMASAQEYAHITDLSRRVAEWEEKVLPRLQEEDTHGAFDIHIYGGRVLESAEKGRKIPFRRIAVNKPTFEICRLFLATLILANTNNVQIHSEGTFVEAVDKFQVELLSTRQHFQELEDYQAPSIADK